MNVGFLINCGRLLTKALELFGPSNGDGLLLEDGAGFLLLEDGSFLLLE